MDQLVKRPMGMTVADVVRELDEHACDLRKRGLHEMSAVVWKRAITLAPADATLLSNLGAAYDSCGDTASAMAVLLMARKLEPSLKIMRTNLAHVHSARGEFAKAIDLLRPMLRSADEDAGVRMHLAFAYLNSGQWQEGLELYETRLEYKDFGVRYAQLPVPMWNGADLGDSTIYVQCEQGIGDTILFSRYIEWLHFAHNRARILFCVPHQLFNLLWHLQELPGVKLVPEGVPFPKEAEYGCFLASLPRLAGVSEKYVQAPTAAILDRVQTQQEKQRFPLPKLDRASKRIGVCWTGNPAQRANQARTVPFMQMMRLLENFDHDVYSLQCGPGASELERFGADQLVYDLKPDIERDMVATALALLELDLVVTCCTSIAHLAGTLGVPTWVLLPHDCYWIWLRHGRTTPWYPSVRLFRQPRQGDWDSVLAAVCAALKE